MSPAFFKKLKNPQVAFAAALLLSGLAASHLHRASAAGASQPAPPRLPEGHLHLDDAQWRSLDLRPAARAPFSSLLELDATVAVDDERTVPVFAPMNGRVLDVRARLGQHVAQDQVLAEVAGTESAQAAEDLASTEAARASAARQLEVAQGAERRAHGALDAGGGTEKDWQQARADLAAAEAGLRTAEAAFAAAHVKAVAVGVGDAGRSSDAARPTALVAPIQGEIVQRQVAAGQFVGSLASNGSPAPLFTVSDLRRVWVLAGVPEAQAAEVRTGLEAEVTLLALGATPRHARVDWVGPTLDPVTHRLPLRLELANDDGALRPEMSARVRLLRAAEPFSLAIPDGGVVRDGAEAHCYVVAGEHELALRAIRIGHSEGGLTQVLSGLAPGERVVARGALFVDAMGEGAGS